MTENIESSFLVEQTFKAQEILAKTNLVLPTEIMLANDLVEDQEDTLWISSEIHQVIKAYKIRGAANAAIQLAANERCLALVTASAGNHAQAVALMANELNVPASIIMPSNTPEYKVDRVESFSSRKTKVILEGETFDEAEEYAKYLAEKQSLFMIHPFNDRNIIEGQGTWALELIKSLKHINNIYVPVGGGGLIAGMASVFKSLSPETRIVAVEPEGAASLTAAYKNSGPKKLESIDTFVDGASVKIVGEIPFNIFKDLVDEVILIDNKETIEATKKLNNKFSPRMIEFAGALSFAAYIKDQGRSKGDSSLCLVTGGNLSRDRYNIFVNQQQ